MYFTQRYYFRLTWGAGGNTEPSRKREDDALERLKHILNTDEKRAAHHDWAHKTAINRYSGTAYSRMSRKWKAKQLKPQNGENASEKSRAMVSTTTSPIRSTHAIAHNHRSTMVPYLLCAGASLSDPQSDARPTQSNSPTVPADRSSSDEMPAILEARALLEDALKDVLGNEWSEYEHAWKEYLQGRTIKLQSYKPHSKTALLLVVHYIIGTKTLSNRRELTYLSKILIN
ncbi:hypothetical protein M501DRAFT_143345 [Patellaria atrata CBS 101060]|uniref:Uncharacterized protein n=1 Tax=Patellaria atrata CBS 101060 TaxID=1346257 RepID=A0A9P4S8I0_9PEZI|nr:hypothetical protein M501DRAFT_143345 [Patellaria atrata CBS 101060]